MAFVFVFRCQGYGLASRRHLERDSHLHTGPRARCGVRLYCANLFDIRLVASYEMGWPLASVLISHDACCPTVADDHGPHIGPQCAGARGLAWERCAAAGRAGLEAARRRLMVTPRRRHIARRLQRWAWRRNRFSSSDLSRGEVRLGVRGRYFWAFSATRGVASPSCHHFGFWLSFPPTSPTPPPLSPPPLPARFCLES